MKTKHTPGPWRKSATTQNAVICDSITGHDCKTNVDYYGGHLIAESIFSEADRDLIASAPDLLEALQDLLDGADAAVAAKAVGPHWWHHGRAKARAAIAKATGSAT